MDNNVNVLHELEVKNREIYTNKLVIDIENNKEIIKITIENMINLFKEDVSFKVIDIINDASNNKDVSNIINDFYLKIKNELFKLIDEKEKILKDKINNIDNIEYEKEINVISTGIINNIKEYYTNNIDLVIDNLGSSSSNRLREYLKNSNYERTINKIAEIILNMDKILYNNYKENVSRFEELNNKTLK